MKGYETVLGDEETQPLPEDAQSPRVPRDMDPETFRRYGHQVIDWIAAYMADPERYPVLAQVRTGEVRARLPLRPRRA